MALKPHASNESAARVSPAVAARMASKTCSSDAPMSMECRSRNCHSGTAASSCVVMMGAYLFWSAAAMPPLSRRR
jgi:hypothetical protein